MADIMLKTQKIIKVGNSCAVSLDKGFMKQAGLEPGTEVTISYDPQTQVVALAAPRAYARAQKSGQLKTAKKHVYVSSRVTPELREWTDRFLKENAQAMEELANL